jgi:hypothetical protein
MLPFLGAVIGSLIGATLAPFVNWQIEKKKQRLAYRKDLISRWRALFEEYATAEIAQWPDETALEMLGKKADFLSFAGHTYGRKSYQLSKSEEEYVQNCGIHPLIFSYLQEIVKLEIEWRLI